MFSCNLYHNDLYWDSGPLSCLSKHGNCIYAENAGRTSNMQSPVNHAVRQYGITDYNKYCFWCIWGEVPPPKWPVCKTARVCGRQSLRTNTYRLNIHQSNTIWEVLQSLSSMPWRSSLKPDFQGMIRRPLQPYCNLFQGSCPQSQRMIL